MKRNISFSDIVQFPLLYKYIDFIYIKLISCISAVRTYLICIILSVISFVAYGVDDLPDLGSSKVNLQEEINIGKKILQSIYTQSSLVNDNEINFYINNLVSHISNFIKIDYAAHTVIFEDDSVNAFASPGGVVGINKGLLLQADSIGEIGFVVAHELGHLSRKHFLRRGNNNSNLAYLLLLSTVLGLAVGGNSGNAIFSGGFAATIDRSLVYSREHEREADQIGFDGMVSAGLDPEDGIKMLQKLSSFPVYLEYMSTHPSGISRVEAARSMLIHKRMHTVMYQNKYKLDGKYKWLKIKLQIAGLSPIARREMMNSLEANKNNLIKSNSISDLYYLSRLYIQSNKWNEAVNTARQVYKMEKNAMSLYLYSEALINQAKYLLDTSSINNIRIKKILNEAKKEIGSYLYFNPSHIPLVALLGDIKAIEGKIDDAIKSMLNFADEYDNSLFFWINIVRWAKLSGNPFIYELFSARLLILQGNFVQAKYKLDNAGKHVGPSLWNKALLEKQLIAWKEKKSSYIPK